MNSNQTIPDAELLRLGAELQLVERDWLAQRTIDNKHRAQWEAACLAANLPPREYRDFASGDEWQAYQARRLAVPHAQPADEVWEQINGKLYDIVLDVLTLYQPQTLAGLAVLVHAVVLDNSEWWSDDMVDSPEHDHLRTFLERCCTFLHLSPAPISTAGGKP